MPRARFAGSLLAAALVVPAALGVWALSEARSQRSEVEQALRAEAALLARTLGPALASASASARELDELLAWKLLDNARLLARLPPLPPDTELEALLETNGVDAALWLAPDGRVERRAGTSPDLDLRAALALRDALAPLLAGEADEVIVGPDAEGAGPVTAAVRTGRGAVAVLADPAGAYAFTRQIGVSNLLRRLVDTDAVLYLAYDEEPGGAHAEASWDGRPVPASLPAPAELRGQRVFEVRMPVPSPAGRSASLRVGLNGAPLARAAASSMRRTALVGTVLAAFGLASAAFAVGQRARFREREEARQRMDELEESRRQSERLAAAGALAAGLAHEVRNPLNGIAMAAQRIERSGGGSGRLAALIRQEVARLEVTLKGFLDLARPSSGRRSPADLGDVAGDALALLELEAAEKDVRLEVRRAAAPVRADPEALRGAVLNLVRNAIQASPPGSRIEVEVGIAGAPGGAARISVRDRGAGIDAALESRAFDPFVTSRASGTGLGLAMVRRVAEEHGGRAWLASRSGGGVEAGFEIPGRAS